MTSLYRQQNRRLDTIFENINFLQTDHKNLPSLFVIASSPGRDLIRKSECVCMLIRLFDR